MEHLSRYQPQHNERKQLRHAYGFDDVALVPGDVTINPNAVDVSTGIGPYRLAIPFLAAAMDGVVDPRFAVRFGRAGGLAVLNLEGVQTRYEDADAILEAIAAAPGAEATALLQRVYQEPIKEHLIARRIQEIKAGGVLAAASVTPPSAASLGPVAVEAGLDILVVQSTVTTARHISSSYRQLSFSELCNELDVPIVVGNCVTYSAAYELMETGVAALLIGVGPGAACTSREVLGIGVPQVTATIDCAAARDSFYRETGRRVAIITDGGMRTGGDICKAIAAGADAVMLGSPFAQAVEAPGRGNHWGMATPNAALPRGTRIRVGQQAPLEQILFGPTSRTDGTQNLVGALKNSMGVCGAQTIQEMQQVEMIIAPSIKTEGKIWQLAGANK